MKRVLVISLWLGLGLLQSFFTRTLGEENNNDDDNVNKQLEMLTNEIIELKAEVKKLNPPNSSDKTDSMFPNILSVNRSVYPDSGDVRFWITYENQNLTINCSWYAFQPHNHTYIKQESFSSWQTSNFSMTSAMTIQKDDRDKIEHLYFVLIAEKTSTALYLDNNINDQSQNGNTSVADINAPVLKTVPEGDFVYEPGKNLTVTFFHPRSHHVKRDPGSSSYIMTRAFKITKDLVLLDPQNATTVGKQSDFFENLGSVVKEKNFLDKTETEIELNTAAANFSGVLTVMSGINLQSNLLLRIERNMEVIVRPLSQKGAFPVGKIYIKNETHELINNNLNASKSCSFGNSCFVYCQFFGVGIDKFKMYKTVAGSNKHVSINSDSLRTSYGIAGTYFHNTTPGNQSAVNVTCEASNHSGNKRVVNIAIEMGFQVKVIDELSSVQRLDNGTMEVICTAEGKPLPRIEIQCGWDTNQPAPFATNLQESRVSARTICPDMNDEDISCFAFNDRETDYLQLYSK